MNALKYLGRKLLYAVVGIGIPAGLTHLANLPDLHAWTLSGFVAVAEAAIAGAILSPLVGGSLSKK